MQFKIFFIKFIIYLLIPLTQFTLIVFKFNFFLN
jgi:hypothetical protein